MDITFGQKMPVSDSLLDMLVVEYYLVGLDITEESILNDDMGKRMIVPVEKWFKKDYGDNKREKRVIRSHNARVEQECYDRDPFAPDFQLRYHKGIAYIKAPDILFGMVSRSIEPDYISLSQVMWTRRESSKEYSGVRRRTNLFDKILHINKDSIESLTIYTQIPRHHLIP